MRTSKYFGWFCLIMLVLSSLAWPGQAFGGNENEPPYLATGEPFDRHLLDSDISNRKHPPESVLDEDGFLVRKEVWSLRQWEPRIEQLQPFEFLQPEITASGDQNRATGTCTVTSTADSGAGTLRECLTSPAAGDVILFDPAMFPPTIPQTIYLTSDQLPWILTNNLTIDASNAGVILDGSALAENALGLGIWGTQGVNIMGMQILNFTFGMVIGGGAIENIIGGDRSIGSGPMGQGNRISGNSDTGIWLQDVGTSNNTIQGNFIGTDLSGGGSVPNNHGLVLAFGASNNQVGGSETGQGNLISGNTNYGIWISGENTVGNQILGNQIGTDISGFTAVPNYYGIYISGSPGNQIGGVAPGAGNLISGNANFGIYVGSVNSPGTTIAGNKIGTNLSGTSALPNYQGICLSGGGSNLIGGTTLEAGNLISGNTTDGIRIAYSSSNRVYGNTIGANFGGTASVPNDSGIVITDGTNNLIGGSSPGMGNLISGNSYSGIWMHDESTVGNQVLGNRIGTNWRGDIALPNNYGVLIIGARETIIGGADLKTPWVCDGPCNLTSGNKKVGIFIEGVPCLGEDPPGVVYQGTQIMGNFIGTNLAGNFPLPNSSGVTLFTQAGDNRVGGNSLLGEGNLISGNLFNGVEIGYPWTKDNQVSGNRIGTTADGNAALPNGGGILMFDGASGNVIGGDSAGLGNLISGNVRGGVWLTGEGTTNNQILGNQIGTNAAGNSAVPNSDGIVLTLSASDMEIQHNVISGNATDGLYLYDSNGNQISDNYIGVAADGQSPLPNGEDGIVLIKAAENTVGPGNIVAYNRYGVAIVYPESFGNTITRNSIYANTIKQIAFFDVPVPLAPAPLLSGWSDVTMTVTGTACTGCLVEVFANPTATPSGRTYLGTVSAGGDGSFSLTIGAGYIYLAATATDAEGSTSEFSNVLQIGEDTHSIYLPLILK